MKKLTIKALSKLLEENYFLGCFKGIIKDRNYFYIIYPYMMAKLIYGVSFGWSVAMYGEINYGTSKHLVSICDKLEVMGYKGESEND